VDIVVAAIALNYAGECDTEVESVQKNWKQPKERDWALVSGTWSKLVAHKAQLQQD
jgi:hypothetical protein